MANNNYKFIFYLLIFTSFESYGQLMFTKKDSKDLVLNPAVQFGDIVFNELMADPTPVVNLPNAEYIELMNTSGFAINIKNWILEINGRKKLLPEKSIGQDSFLIITGTGWSAQFDKYGQILEISGLAIANDGAILKLISSSGALIDSLNYHPTMHKAGYSVGGYSLERIDPRRKCGMKSNWETSIDKNGGTPGIENSVFRNNLDLTPPTVNSVSIKTSGLLEVVVTEIPYQSLKNENLFTFSPSLPNTDSIRFDFNLLKYSIYFPEGSIKNGVDYKLAINGLADECGNMAPIIECEFWYYHPKSGDLLISEVLFNPFPGGVDFVEIYNFSGRKIALGELLLGARDKNHEIRPVYPVTSTYKVLLPNYYSVFTSDSALLLKNYYSESPESIVKMEKFPGYNLDEGWVVLLNKEMEIIDEFHYNENMHHPLISDVKGISLERSSFLKSSNDPVNWHSASKTVGFATPGYRNSTAEIEAESTEMFTFEPKIFSPNDDGMNDQFFIRLSSGEPGLMVSIRIYNRNGLEIRRLANNLTLGTEDVIVWDGMTQNRQKANPGIYIIHVELFGLQSGRKQFKAACVLTDRLE